MLFILVLFVLVLALYSTMLPLFFAVLCAANVALASSLTVSVSETERPTSSPTPTQTARVVVLKNGSYSGVYSPGYNQDFFLGIPYAQVSLASF